MALVGRLLEAQGFRVGILSQPDWRDVEAFRALGRPDRHVGRDGRQHGLDGQPVHVGPADAPRRRLLAGRRGRAAAGSRADRLRADAAARRSPTCRSSSAASRPACGGSPTTTTGRTRCGGRSLIDSRADLLVYGNGERAVVEIAHRLAAGEAPTGDHRPARHGVLRPAGRRCRDGWTEIDSTRDRRAGPVSPAPVDPYAVPQPSGPPAPRRLRARRAAPTRWFRAPACGRGRRPRARRSCACPISTPSRPTRCCTRTRRASCTSSRTRATRARWCSVTAPATSG